MKKLICVVLCLLMLVVGLVSCGGSGTTDPSSVDRPNVTLKMAIIVDDNTTDEGIKAMQDAFNAECEVALNTRIEFVCLKAADYEAQLDAIMENLEDEEARLEAGEEDAKAESTGGSDVTNAADGEFPAATAAQFDIVLVTGKDMYNKYIENKWIVGLNSHLTGTYKVLNTKILDVVKEKLKVEGEIYGIPSLRGMGEYTYLSVNKEALAYYNINESDIDSISDVRTLFLQMQNAGTGHGLDKWQDKYANTTFSPILNKKEDFVYPTVKYLSRDGSFSLAGALYEKDSVFGNHTVNNVLLSANLLSSDDYSHFLETEYLASKNGYYGTGTEAEYLVGLCKGDYSLRFSDPDYYYCAVDNPVLTEDEVFESLLCVSAFSSQAKRSVEIIQELMTNNTRTGLLNILLYGVSQENYTLENGVVNLRLNYNYAMHRDYLVGNLAETAYPCADYGQNSRTYENVVQQNKDMGNRVPLFNDTYESYFRYVNTEKWAWIDELSDACYAELMACENLEAYRAKVEEFKAYVGTGAAGYEDPADPENPDDPNDPYNSVANQFALLVWCDTDPGAVYTTLGEAFFAYIRDNKPIQ